MTKKIAILFLVFSLFLTSASPILANGLLIEFETDPLFDEVNFLPGDNITRWIKVKNTDSNSRKVIAKIEGINDPDDLSEQMNIIINDNNDIIYFNNTLNNFFSQKEINLGIVTPNESRQYNFSVNFNFSTPNPYQKKTLEFDIIIGSEGDDGGGGGGGEGGSTPFKITSENVKIDCKYATITWLTNKFSTSRVVYGTSHSNINLNQGSNYGYASSTLENFDLVTGHSIQISNLTPNTTYYFRPISVYNNKEKYGQEIKALTPNCKIKILGEEGRPNLTIQKIINAKFANPGDNNIEYTIKINNIGNLTAYNTILRDVLPKGLMFADNNSSTKIWLLGNIKPQEKQTIKYYVNISTSTKAGIYINEATLQADNNNPVKAQAELKIKKIKVLGTELAPTGFNFGEFLLLIILATASIFTSILISKKSQQPKI